ncbi:hypothetical protein [Halobacillus naozhouensis]|uniref:Uncharacterized protein n=1 Tax=Halobacillus naozhouensis TaxID=554880 RepID=A0ABY8IWN9_9BACI|nr:hypothetical protein [Halobacillus naozhouensis]WFT74625.1 hypothetical protein P9989_20110 [Halobacillus naozhouensis]
MQQTAIFRTGKILTVLFAVLFVVGILTINSLFVYPLVNTSRSLMAFLIAPLCILYANQHNLWFRSSLRIFLKGSHRLVTSMSVFFVGVLLSYEVLRMLPNDLGTPLHLIILGICSIIYWGPLLIDCSFHKPMAYSSKFAYFTGTTLLFFTYHQLTFVNYHSAPTLGFMWSGLATMLTTLMVLIHQWFRAEKKTDRKRMEGYLRPLKKI